jgi:glutathione synthase/RimK-type ligase-like ATP-grasp enzyme
MAYKILSCGVSKPSARILRNAIVELTGKRIWVTKRTDGDGFPSIYIMRYGHIGTIPPEFRIGPTVGFNSTHVINVCSNKYTFSTLMKQNNIYSPEFFSSKEDVHPGDFPIMIRDSLCSYGGRGITVVKNMDEFIANWVPGYYWTRFIKMPFEYRVHLLGGKIARIFKKIKETEGDEEDLPVRNVGHGYHFSLQNASSFVQDRIEPIVNEVYSVLPGNYMALDIGWDRENQKYFVMEANSAPGLNTRTAKDYAEYLAPLLFPN